ncbi:MULTISPECIES: hypothetical protein [Methylomonas]|nr:hypothetical protein [Methylomonas koyamae]
MKLKQLLIMLFVVTPAITQSRADSQHSPFAPEFADTIHLPAQSAWQAKSSGWTAFCASSACRGEDSVSSYLPKSSARTGVPAGATGRSFEVNWFDYPAISSGAWALLPDFSYRLTIAESANPPRQSRLAALTNLPIATAWFGLGSLLGCLALQRRRYQTSRSH